MRPAGLLTFVVVLPFAFILSVLTTAACSQVLVWLLLPSLTETQELALAMFIALALILAYYWRRSQLPLREAFGLSAFGLNEVYLILVSFGFLYILSNYLVVLFRLVGWELSFSVLGDTTTENFQSLLTGIAFANAFLAPVYEEILFRGVLFRSFRIRYGFSAGMILSSLLFALVHVIPATVIYAFGFGLVSCLLVAKTGSIIPSICMHLLFNSTSLLLTLGSIDLPKLTKDMPILIHFSALTMAVVCMCVFFSALRGLGRTRVMRVACQNDSHLSRHLT